MAKGEKAVKELRESEYKVALQQQKAIISVGDTLLENENYMKAADTYAKAGYQKGIEACIKGLEREGKYRQVGRLIHYLSPKAAKQYIIKLSSAEKGKYLKYAGKLAAELGYKPLAKRIASQLDKRDDNASVSTIYALIEGYDQAEDRGGSGKEKQEEPEQKRQAA